ncbi:hypothetical protein QTP88_018219 [Uroleucon formosanum]
MAYDVLLKLQNETYLFINSPPNNKLRISHEEIIIQWKKYQDDDYKRLRRLSTSSGPSCAIIQTAEVYIILRAGNIHHGDSFKRFLFYSFSSAIFFSRPPLPLSATAAHEFSLRRRRATGVKDLSTFIAVQPRPGRERLIVRPLTPQGRSHLFDFDDASRRDRVPLSPKQLVSVVYQRRLRRLCKKDDSLKTSLLLVLDLKSTKKSESRSPFLVTFTTRLVQ